MNDSSQYEPNSTEEFKSRIETLEAHVKELGYALYEVLEGLRGVSPGTPRCPPICPRSPEKEAS